MTIINSRSVLEALCGYQTGFARTPKYAIGGQQKVHLENIQYRSRSGWLPYAEVLVGTFFLAMVVFAIESFNYLAVPFLLLFVGGYYWAGFTTLWAEYQGRVRWQRQRDLAAAAAQRVRVALIPRSLCGCEQSDASPTDAILKKRDRNGDGKCCANLPHRIPATRRVDFLASRGLRKLSGRSEARSRQGLRSRSGIRTQDGSADSSRRVSVRRQDADGELLVGLWF